MLGADLDGFLKIEITLIYDVLRKEKVLLDSIKPFDLISKLQEIKGTEDNRTI